jgi:long-chain fatty acid transport protein
MKLFLKFFLVLLAYQSLNADTFQNVNGFFGERAAGMGGAYSAISDDVSGTYYNPGGISFAQNSYYSINASSYNQIKVNHKNLFGPGQNYTRNSRNYLPNFIGFIKKDGKLTYGFSVLNPINQSFDQSDRITLPIYRRNLSQLDISFTEENFRLLAGPSVSYLLTDKLGIGLTTYYMYDSNRTIVNSNENQFNENVTTVTEQNRRRTSGIIPVLGIQYMLTEKFSLGLSMRRIYVTGGNVSYRTNVTTAGRTGGPSSITIQSTEEGGGKADTFNLTLLSPSTYQIPQTTEIRFGGAFFINRKFTVSADTIYTSGYWMKIANNTYDTRTGSIGLSDPYANDLRRNQTLNYSVGLEYFIMDNLVIRLGHFTNRSNNEKTSWGEAAWFASYRQINRASTDITLRDNLTYKIPEKREQYINLMGYSIGIGLENARNSISLTLMIQNGKGLGTIDRNQLPSTSIYRESTAYLSGSTRY